MGLDMYFKKIRKVKGKTINELLEIQNNINYGDDKLLKEKLLKEYQNYLHKHEYNFVDKTDLRFDYEIGYLRKANAIHKYIVDNFNNGIDDCKPILLDKQKIATMYEIVATLIYDCNFVRNEKGDCIYLDKKSEELAKKMLPTSEGFFFGSVDYSTDYYEDLLDFRYILKMLYDVDNEKYDIFYRASW